MLSNTEMKLEDGHPDGVDGLTTLWSGLSKATENNDANEAILTLTYQLWLLVLLLFH